MAPARWPAPALPAPLDLSQEPDSAAPKIRRLALDLGKQVKRKLAPGQPTYASR
jgi:hypothetical protein